MPTDPGSIPMAMTPPDDSSSPRIRPTSVEWICLLGGVFLSLQYAWVLDDAFVYFRYIDNLLQLGHGLVYNQGEYVEGFTSPLWCMLFVALRVVESDYWLLVRLVAVASFVVFWWLLVRLNRELSPRTGPVLNFPLIALSFNYAVTTYFTSGVETPLVQVAAVGYALFVVRPQLVTPMVLVALSPLIRPELTLGYLLVLAWAWVRARAAAWRLALLGGATLGAWLLFRIGYYAELLPNTFYLKHLSDVGQGFVYLHQSLSPYGFYIIAPAFVGVAVVLRKRGIELAGSRRLLLLLVATAIAAYFVRIGGDPRHYRYLAFSYCLALAATAGLAEHALTAFAPRVRGAAVLALGLVLAVLVAWGHPPQLSGHPIGRNIEHRQIDKINDAELHRAHEHLIASPWSLEPRFDQSESYAAYSASQPETAYRGAVVQTWCFGLWQRFDLRAINSAGLTDAILARTEMKPNRPAHKFGLRRRANDLVQVYRQYPPGRGTLRRAVDAGVAPDWIAENLDTLEVLERKIYNEHDFLENLGLAFTFPPPIGK